jgi:hypothetical protein
MKKKNENYLVKRLIQVEVERKRLAQRVLTNIKEMNEKQNAWVKQRFERRKQEK